MKTSTLIILIISLVFIFLILPIIIFSVIRDLVVDDFIDEGSSCLDAIKQVAIQDEGYTCYNSMDNISIQISRGSGDFELENILVIFESETETITFNLLNKSTTMYPLNLSLPGANEQRVYRINATNAGFISYPETVKIAAIVSKDGNPCDASQPVVLKFCETSCVPIPNKNSEEFQECCNKERANYVRGCEDGSWVIWDGLCTWACTSKPLIPEL